MLIVIVKDHPKNQADVGYKYLGDNLFVEPAHKGLREASG